MFLFWPTFGEYNTSEFSLFPLTDTLTLEFHGIDAGARYGECEIVEVY